MAQESPEAGSEVLDLNAQREEEFVLALRTRTGVSARKVDPEVISACVDAGLVDHIASTDRLVLTRRGRLLATEVTVRLLAGNNAGTRYDGVLTAMGKDRPSV